MMKSLFKPVAFALVAATLAVTAAPQKAEAGNGGAIVAGAVIGLAAGLIAGSAHGANDHGYRPRRERDHGYRPQRETSRTVCEIQETYNKYGEFIGEREVCRKVRNRY